MDETEIAQKLRAKTTQPVHNEAEPVVSDPHEVPVKYELDEITQYKLHQHFGENYREGDETARQQLQYIYEHIADRIGSKEYPFVVAKINELRRMLGLNYDNNSRYKLYQWLKLDQKRTKIEMEMNNIQ